MCESVTYCICGIFRFVVICHVLCHLFAFEVRERCISATASGYDVWGIRSGICH